MGSFDRCHSFKTLLNVLILALVGLPVLLFANVKSPQQRGFYCNDDSLSYPLLPSTISTTTLILGGLIIPILAILIVETVKKSTDNHDEDKDIFTNYLPPKIIAIITMIGYLFFGCGCIQTITDISKYSIGRLRPNFHTACQTDWGSIKDNCSDTFYPVYIYPIPCLNPNHHEIRDARLSFFSGHASFSSFTMIYLIIYLQQRLTWNHPRLLKPFIQFLCLLITMYTSISRVFDYYHHWSDVFFGFIMGAIMAYLIARYVSGLLRGNREYKQIANEVEAV